MRTNWVSSYLFLCIFISMASIRAQYSQLPVMLRVLFSKSIFCPVVGVYLTPAVVIL